MPPVIGKREWSVRMEERTSSRRRSRCRQGKGAGAGARTRAVRARLAGKDCFRRVMIFERVFAPWIQRVTALSSGVRRVHSFSSLTRVCYWVGPGGVRQIEYRVHSGLAAPESSCRAGRDPIVYAVPHHPVRQESPTGGDPDAGGNRTYPRPLPRFRDVVVIGGHGIFAPKFLPGFNPIFLIPRTVRNRIGDNNIYAEVERWGTGSSRPKWIPRSHGPGTDLRIPRSNISRRMKPPDFAGRISSLHGE